MLFSFSGGQVKSAIDKDQAEQGFRKIDIGFLKAESTELYDVFYRTQVFGSPKFVKFASNHPSHHEKVLKVIASGESTEEFYIHEEDLIKYHQQATQSLRTMISNPQIPLKKKTQKIYDLSKEVMKEFFNKHASEKILRSSEEVMSVMDQCLTENGAGFHSISLITSKDYYTYTHSVNVGLFCMTYGIKTKMGQNDTRNLGLGGMLHDVGKVKIDSAVINKNGKLTPEEFRVIQGHSMHGREILESMRCYESNVIRMAGEHHERFNGGGYPDGLVGEEIAYFARICKVMDVYDALTTRRTYKKALAPIQALTIMKKEMEDEFDLQILDNFVKFMGPGL